LRRKCGISGSAILPVFGQKFVSIFIGLGIAALLARSLSLEDFGIYAILMSIFGIIATPLSRSISIPLLRYVSLNRERIAQEDLSRLFRFSMIRGALAALLALVTLVLCNVTGYFSVPLGVIELLAWSFSCFLICTATGFSAITWGFGRADIAHLPLLLAQPASFFTLILLLFLAEKAELELIAICFVGSYLCAVGVSRFFEARVSGSARLSREAQNLPFERSSKPIILSIVAQQAMVQIELLALGLFQMPADAALFRVGYAIGHLANLGAMLTRLIFSGDISAAMRGSAREIRDEVSRSMIFAALFAAVTAIGIVATGPFVIPAIFGEGFRPSYQIDAALSCTNVVGSIGAVAGNSLHMLNRSEAVARALLTALTVKVVLVIVLVYAFGLAGAVVSSMLGTLLIQFILRRELRRQYRWD